MNINEQLKFNELKDKLEFLKEFTDEKNLVDKDPREILALVNKICSKKWDSETHTIVEDKDEDYKIK